MEHDTNWDVRKHRNHYDSDEVWELKAAFMEKNQRDIPEERLVCLTQTMVNIEVLGCRYPDQLRSKIEELGGDIITKYRSLRKNRNKRTFVSASDAAQGYVKRAPKQRKLEDMEPKKSIGGRGDPFLGRYGRMILFHSIGCSSSAAIINHSCDKAKIKTREADRRTGKEFIVDFFINEELVATGSAETKPLAKQAAKDSALRELEKQYYTIKVKQSYLAEPEEDEGDVKDSASPYGGGSVKFQPLGEKNVGFRMLKSLGWSPGTGLTSEGILEPVTFDFSGHRKGLGCDEKGNVEMDKYREMLESYAHKTTFYDLVFDDTLSKDDRSRIHKYSEQFGLKTKSHNINTEKGKTRQLVVSKDINLFRLGHLLLSGEFQEDHVLFQKYEIIPPTGK